MDGFQRQVVGTKMAINLTRNCWKENPIVKVQSRYEVFARSVFYRCRTESFRQSGFLPEDDAAIFALACGDELSERSVGNPAWRGGLSSTLYAPGRMGIDCAIDCRLSSQSLHGAKFSSVSRIQADGALDQITFPVGVHFVGVVGDEAWWTDATALAVLASGL